MSMTFEIKALFDKKK